MRAVGFASLLLLAASTAMAEPRVIHVTARKFAYDPAEIHVRAGEDVVLELETLDRRHGFHVPALGIRSNIDPGQPVHIPLHVDTPGRYEFACDVFCGSGHEDMEGVLVVE